MEGWCQINDFAELRKVQAVLFLKFIYQLKFYCVCVKFSHITAVWGYKSNPSIYIEEGNMNALQYSCLENPWTEEPGGLQSTESQELDTTEQLTHTRV